MEAWQCEMENDKVKSVSAKAHTHKNPTTSPQSDERSPSSSSDADRNSFNVSSAANNTRIDSLPAGLQRQEEGTSKPSISTSTVMSKTPIDKSAVKHKRQVKKGGRPPGPRKQEPSLKVKKQERAGTPELRTKLSRKTSDQVLDHRGQRMKFDNQPVPPVNKGTALNPMDQGNRQFRMDNLI